MINKCEVCQYKDYCSDKDKKKNKSIAILFAIFAALVLVGMVGEEEEVVPEKAVVEETVEATPTPTPVMEKYKYYGIGETADYKDVEVTLVEVYQGNGVQFCEAGAGKTFLVFEFEFVNKSDDVLHISTYEFDGYCDDYSVTDSLTAEVAFQTSNGGELLSGTVDPGKKLKGIIGYEVDQNWETMELYWNPNFWNDRVNLVFEVNADDLG